MPPQTASTAPAAPQAARPAPLARPEPRPGVMAIEAYVPGKSAVPTGVTPHKLSSNENPFGASPKAVAAARAAIETLAVYPDGSASALRAAIARKYGLDPQRIVVGNGSDELLEMLAKAYLGPGDEGVFSAHGFLVYRIAILTAGAAPVVAPERAWTSDVDAILERVTDRTRVVFLANPNNPTGTYLPFDEVRRLHAALPPNVLLVLDAAYAEYVRRNDYASGLELALTAENVVMTRTFSKVYGLAALRLGWMVGPAHVVDALERIRPPFNVNAAALAAGVAAIEDEAHVAASVAHNEAWAERLAREIAALGLAVTPSVANFLMIHFPEEPGRTAADADAFLTARGLVLRRIASYGLPHALRMSIGTDEANTLVIEGLRDFLEGRDA